LLVLMMW